MLPSRNPRLPNTLLNTPDNFLTEIADIKLRLEELEVAQTPPIEEIIGGRLTIADLILSPALSVTTTDPTSTEYTGAFMAGEGILFDGSYYVLGNVVNGEIKTGFTDVGTLYAIDAEIEGTIIIGAGSAGGWLINATQIYSLASDIGIILDSSVPIIRVGDTSGNHIEIDGINQRIRSSNFVTGAAGLNLNTATGDAEFNNIVARGELKTFLFTSQNQMAVAGDIVVTKDAGKLATDVASGDTTVDFGKSMTPGEWIRIQGPDAAGSAAAEWMLVGSNVSGTTYNVTRNVDGTGANNWLKDSPFVVIGADGDSRIELTAGASATLRLITQGPTWDRSRIQAEMSTVDGAITAGNGAVRLDDDGIFMPEAGDALVLRSTTYDAVISQITNPSTGSKDLSFLLYQASLTEILTNGNFNTGDLTGWTENDTGSHIAVVSDESYEGQYSVRFVGATASDYIEQTFSSKPYGLVVRFRAMVSASTATVLLEGSAGSRLFNELATDTQWRTFYGVILGATTVFRLKVTNNAGNTVWIDDISVRELSGAGVTTRTSSYLFGVQNAKFTTSQFTVDNLDGNIILQFQNSSGQLVFNLNTIDIDTIFRGDTDSNLLYINAGTDRVGIGLSNPTEKLEVNGNQRLAGYLTLDELAADPSTPSTGDWKLYTKSDGLYLIDDAGAVTGPFGTGGGSTDGWNAVTDTWTRTGNHTYTVSGDVTVTYRKGTKVRYKDGGSFEYGVIISSTHSAGTTTVQLCPNSDYAMAAATITDKSLSYIENPEGFPDWLNWAPAATGFSGTPTGNGLIKFAGINAYVHVRVDGTSNATTFTVTNLPVAPAMGFDIAAINGITIDGGTIQTTPGRAAIVDATTTILFRSNTANGAWTNSGNKRAQTFIFYRF